tara:strand:- start:593 stop:1543 length:951 start_codon:yes stop_codon:yes gene_type:complete
MDFIREVFNALKYLILFAINSVIVIYLFEHFFPIDEHLILAIDPMTAMAIGSIGVSLYQGYRSKKQKEQGEQDLIDAEQAQKDAIAAMRAVEIQNKLQALQVPTLGAEVRERAITRALGTGVEAAQEGGPEAIIGGLPRMQAQADVASAQIAGDLDTLEAQRDRAVLSQDQAIEMERKQRELGIQNMILGGAGLAAADAQRLQQMGQLGMNQAIGGIITGAAAAAPAYLGQTGGGMDMAAQTQMASTQPNQYTTSDTDAGMSMINPAQQSPAYMQYSPAATSLGGPIVGAPPVGTTMTTSTGQVMQWNGFNFVPVQ